jgi:hypothetical protein
LALLIRRAVRLAAASLDGLFEHPGECNVTAAISDHTLERTSAEFLNSLMGLNPLNQGYGGCSVECNREQRRAPDQSGL